MGDEHEQEPHGHFSDGQAKLPHSDTPGDFSEGQEKEHPHSEHHGGFAEGQESEEAEREHADDRPGSFADSGDDGR